MMKNVCLIFCLWLPFAKADASDGLKKINEVFKRLRTGDGFHARVIKTVRVVSLDRTTESKGEMDFSKGRMRLDITQPEKLLLVFDGKTAWQEEQYNDGQEKKSIITKLPAQKIKKGNAILATLLGDASLLHNFKLIKQIGFHYELRPVDKASDVKVLKIDLDGRDLKSVSYIDGLENEVTFAFEKFHVQRISADKFKYQLPKGAEVNEL